MIFFFKFIFYNVSEKLYYILVMEYLYRESIVDMQKERSGIQTMYV